MIQLYTRKPPLSPNPKASGSGKSKHIAERMSQFIQDGCNHAPCQLCAPKHCLLSAKFTQSLDQKIIYPEVNEFKPQGISYIQL